MGLFRTLTGYYRTKVGEAGRHFDLVETTVSHLFRHRHPALDGRSYGGAFHAALARDGWLREGDRFLEIGAGTGGFARGFLAESRARSAPGARLDYTIADLTPSLIDGQRRTLAEHRADPATALHWIRCDAQRLPLATSSFGGVVISNEVIADFDAVRADPARLAKGSAKDPRLAAACERIERYRLELDDPRQFLNVGAIELVEELARVLAPGGRAAIAEYGQDGPSREAVLYDGWFTRHTEYAIDFRHLRRVAAALGLAVEERNLHDFLGFSADVRVLNYTDVRRLKTVSRALEVQAWTEDDLHAAHPELVERYELRFRPAGDPSFPDDGGGRAHGGFRGLFRVLLLRRP
jgi:SAM-dependent methyltransferase